MSEKNEQGQSKLVGMRRSSLKASEMNNKLDSEKLSKLKNKRNSVSWGKSNLFQFKAMKAMFQESKDIEKPTPETVEKHQKFVESRRKSIKNEFSIVKEMMKNAKIEEDEELDEEVKNNTTKNVEIGKEALNDESDSESSKSENSENSEGKDKEKEN